MMSTRDEIVMQGNIDDIFRLAVEVERWPEILPHYRWVSILDAAAEGPTVEMAARRDWIPVRWVAIQTINPARHEIYYRHIDGPTQGMSVVWRLEQLDIGVHVSIVHELTLQRPLLRTGIGKIIVGGFFVKYIAEQTLRQMKTFVEREG